MGHPFPLSVCAALLSPIVTTISVFPLLWTAKDGSGQLGPSKGGLLDALCKNHSTELKV